MRTNGIKHCGSLPWSRVRRLSVGKRSGQLRLLHRLWQPFWEQAAPKHTQRWSTTPQLCRTYVFKTHRRTKSRRHASKKCTPRGSLSRPDIQLALAPLPPSLDFWYFVRVLDTSISAKKMLYEPRWIWFCWLKTGDAIGKAVHLVSVCQVWDEGNGAICFRRQRACVFFQIVFVQHAHGQVRAIIDSLNLDLLNINNAAVARTSFWCYSFVDHAFSSYDARGRSSAPTQPDFPVVVHKFCRKHTVQRAGCHELDLGNSAAARWRVACACQFHGHSVLRRTPVVPVLLRGNTAIDWLGLRRCAWHSDAHVPVCGTSLLWEAGTSGARKSCCEYGSSV